MLSEIWKMTLHLAELSTSKRSTDWLPNWAWHKPDSGLFTPNRVINLKIACLLTTLTATHCKKHDKCFCISSAPSNHRSDVRSHFKMAFGGPIKMLSGRSDSVRMQWSLNILRLSCQFTRDVYDETSSASFPSSHVLMFSYLYSIGMDGIGSFPAP